MSVLTENFILKNELNKLSANFSKMLYTINFLYTSKKLNYEQKSVLKEMTLEQNELILEIFNGFLIDYKIDLLIQKFQKLTMKESKQQNSQNDSSFKQTQEQNYPNQEIKEHRKNKKEKCETYISIALKKLREEYLFSKQ